MSNIIKNSRIINKKKPTKDDSVFLSTTKTESKVEFNKTEEETDYDETEQETEKDETINEETEVEETEESELEETEKEEESEKEDETEYKEEEPVTEEGEYKLSTVDKCLYNKLEDEIIIDDEIDIDIEEKVEEMIVPPEDRITKNRLTIYERVRILGLRAKQISLGAKILIKNYGNRSPLEIAELELKHKVLPYKIKRPLVNNRIEIWKLSELKV